LDLNKAAWLKSTLSINGTIKEAVNSLDDSALKIILVVDEEYHLVGTISDGDIRRALLRGLTLMSPIKDVLNNNPLVVNSQINREVVIQLMMINKIYQIPIVNEQNIVIGLHIFDQINSPIKRVNSVVIMAGGKGTRLLPNTESCPKPMLKITGKPMLQHIIERAKLNGFEKFIIATHYLGKVIEEYFGDGRAFGVEIDYLRESKPLGTAGALGLIANAQNQPLIVTNGDVITDINYGELLDFHVNSIGTATVAVNSYEWQIPFGVVEIKGLNVVRIEEKPISKVYINAGIYVINPEVLAEIKSNSYLDMTSLLENLKIKGHRIVAYPMHEPWRDIGRHEDLIAANK